MRTKFMDHCCRFLSIVTMLILLLSAAGCGSGTQVAGAGVQALPTAKITFSQPGPYLQGSELPLVIKVEPYEELTWKWSVSGTSGGTLSAAAGENVIYTAGKPGTDIVEAKGTTKDGRTIKVTESIKVEPAQAPTTAPTVASAATQPSAATQTPLPSSTPAQLVTLTSIANEDLVPCSNLARGLYPLDLKDEIWPVVYINGVYYPQDQGGKAARKLDGAWSQTVRFGECEKPDRNAGDRFELFIVTADEQANAAFEKYIQTANASKSWSGLGQLPAGTKTHVHIIVTRKKE